jgi:hypothetical protein
VQSVLGRLAGGALWGLGAVVALSMWQGAGGGGGRATAGLRSVAKSAVKAYLTVTERLRETAAEAREGLDDLYAEAQAERRDDLAGEGRGVAGARG